MPFSIQISPLSLTYAHFSNGFSLVCSSLIHSLYYESHRNPYRKKNARKRAAGHGDDELAVKIQRTAWFRCSSLFLCSKVPARGGASPSPTARYSGFINLQVGISKPSVGRGGACSSSCRYFFTLKKQQNCMIKMQSCLIFRISPLIHHPH